MNWRKLTAFLLAFVMLITLMPSDVEAARKVSLNKKKLNLTVGKKYKLKLKNLKKGTKVSWSSSRKNVASVSRKGKK